MERLTFNNICKELRIIYKIGNDWKKSLDFFHNYFCYGELPLNLSSNEHEQNFQKMFSRTFSKNGAIQHTELSDESGKFGELVENFDFIKCSKKISDYVQENNINGFKDNCLKLKDQLTPSVIGFDIEKNDLIAGVIKAAFEVSEYDGVMLAILVSLYPCTYINRNHKVTVLPKSQDHSDRLVCAIKKYSRSLLNNGIKVKHMPDSIMAYFRSASKKITDSAYENCGRLIPSSVSEKYGKIKDMTLCCTYKNNSHEEKEYTLEQIVSENPAKNIMAVGPGGCGKTYSLIDLARKLLNDNHSNVIPLYIELKEFNNYRKASLLKHVFKLISRNSSIELDRVKADMNNWLVRNKDVKLLFLLDGFNEITSDDLQTSIARDICELIKNYGFIHFVITSRYDMTDSFYRGGAGISQSFKPYAVKELSDEVVMEYIDKLFTGDPNRSAIRQNALIKKNNNDEKEIVKTFLKNPMALIMYCLIKKAPDIISKPRHDDCQTLGELIDNYIALIKLSSESESESEGKGKGKSESENNKAEHFLQYIGFEMNNNGLFSLPSIKLDDSMNKLREKLKGNSFIKDVTKYKQNDRIEFIHQNYRDYFAAKFLARILESGDATKINTYFGEQVISKEVKELLGEILGEYRFKNSDKDTVIQSQLKGGNKSLSAPAIAQLISTAADARGGDMSSFDFSNLDLTATSLNSIKLYKNLNEFAKFDGSLLTKYTLNARGQPGAVYSMLWIKDRYLFSFSKSGFFCFDMQTRKHFRITDYAEYPVHAAISLDDKYILTGDDSGTITLWSYEIPKKGDFKMDAVFSKKIKNGSRAVKIWDMVKFGETIYVSGEGGSIHSFSVKEISKKLQIPDCREEIIFNSEAGNTSLCRVTASENNLYCSFENTIMKRALTNDRFSNYLKITSGEIVDIAAVDFGAGESVLVNVEDKDRSGSAFSQILSFKDGKRHQVTEKRHHSKGRVGFKGWISFSEPYGKTIFITALIEDAPHNPGLLKISADNKGTLFGLDYWGNNHLMSVNCAVRFEYNAIEYIATGSTERSVEILSSESDGGTLLYHLEGHYNGIHYIDVIGNNVIYAAHYSGEVSRWEFIDNKWLCKDVYSPHTSWVWECCYVPTNPNSHVISCSYDNTIAITDVQTGEKIVGITEPNARVLSLGFLSNNLIFTGYNDVNDKTTLRVFEIDYDKKRYKSSEEFNDLNENGYELRSIHTVKRVSYKNILFLCANNGKYGTVFRFEKNPVVNSKKLALKKVRDLKENNGDVVIRCMDDKQFNDKELLACGGDYKNNSVKNGFYAAVWDDLGSSVSIVDLQGHGCSAIRLYEYKNQLYLITGDYHGIISIYKINFKNGGYERVCSSESINDKILCIQCRGKNAYLSTLDGKVYALSVDTAIKNRSFKPTELFKAVSGMRCCYVDFTRINEKSDLDDDFRDIISHYGKVGKP